MQKFLYFIESILRRCLHVYFSSLSNTSVCNQTEDYIHLQHTHRNGHPCHVVTASIRDCGSGQSGDSCSSDGREIGADINGTKLWSGRKEKWLGVWTSRSGRGELVLLKLQGAYSGQVDRRASRATGLGNRPAQGHTQFSALHTQGLQHYTRTVQADSTFFRTLHPLQGTTLAQPVSSVYYTLRAGRSKYGVSISERDFANCSGTTQPPVQCLPGTKAAGA